MGYELFEGKGSGSPGRGKQEPKISLRASQSIGVNRAAVDEYFSDADWVEMYYDPKKRMVALDPKKEETSNTYKIRKSKKKNHGGQINCTAFIKEYDLTPKQTKRFKPEWNRTHNMVEIDLDEPVQTIQSESSDD